ncbi:hypothetical protein [Tahibacter harae]|uniref:Uncharacterized protein n=1 Tax=Tahibacter harae TaxID=2963937 RepID=A0ABT1QVS9_9GAMM|nr:hypothetical protein [Tahibacter harae]MCQ4166390.1 hypothetical protein [Tahibacter harae]
MQTQLLGLSSEQWAAVSAIASSISALVAAFAIFFSALATKAALSAARAANEANEQNRLMAKEARERRARSVAGPLKREIEELLRALTPYYATRSAIPAKGTWMIGTMCKRAIEAPLLERLVERWDDFDENTASRLGHLASAVARMHGPYDVDSIPEDSPDFVTKSFLDNMAKDFDRLSHAAARAAECLSKYTQEDEEIDPKTPHPFEEIEAEASKHHNRSADTD